MTLIPPEKSTVMQESTNKILSLEEQTKRLFTLRRTNKTIDKKAQV